MEGQEVSFDPPATSTTHHDLLLDLPHARLRIVLIWWGSGPRSRFALRCPVSVLLGLRVLVLLLFELARALRALLRHLTAVDVLNLGLECAK